LPTEDPTKWVNDWPIQGLTPNHRKLIKAELLKGHAAFYRADTNEPFGYLNAMRTAFNGIAGVLFDARLLTLGILNSELRLFVLESAIAGEWWHAQNDTREEIFPGHLGHRDEWNQLCEHRPGLFAAEISEWHSRLLQAEVEQNDHSIPDQREPTTPEAQTKESCAHARRSSVDRFLSECNKHSKMRIRRRHIWLAVGHSKGRQFEHWQACDEEATESDDTNFPRVLRMKPEQFVALLKEKHLLT
jgi:hypothetical protein